MFTNIFGIVVVLVEMSVKDRLESKKSSVAEMEVIVESQNNEQIPMHCQQTHKQE
jgi:hypothetical protein